MATSKHSSTRAADSAESVRPTELIDPAINLLVEIESLEDRVFALTMAGVSYCENMDDQTCTRLFEVIQELLESRECHNMLRERITELTRRAEAA